MSPWIAAHAASFIGAGIGKSGNPCARLIAPYWFATRVISRITDSVKVLARFAVAARAEALCVLVIVSLSATSSNFYRSPVRRILSDALLGSDVDYPAAAATNSVFGTRLSDVVVTDICHV